MHTNLKSKETIKINQAVNLSQYTTIRHIDPLQKIRSTAFSLILTHSIVHIRVLRRNMKLSKYTI